ncbi:GNAT family N-acetyltransferase [Haloplanus litoreus]|uniref:GNAT family N-acetyltransferase n=1 Tax=Haloplanus litoreus TaxID=767515 RepID=A0ABD5ZZM4_9EURY
MVAVESAEPDDADAVADRWADLAAGQRRYGSHLRPDESGAAIRELMARAAADGRLDVARTDDDIVGFVRYDIERGPLAQDVIRGVVRDLYVDPERRGEGVGGALLDAAERELLARGADVVTVEAMADNEDAIRLYERRGYRPHRIAFEREVENDKRSRGNR